MHEVSNIGILLLSFGIIFLFLFTNCQKWNAIIPPPPQPEISSAFILRQEKEEAKESTEVSHWIYWHSDTDIVKVTNYNLRLNGLYRSSHINFYWGCFSFFIFFHLFVDTLCSWYWIYYVRNNPWWHHFINLFYSHPDTDKFRISF